MTTTSQKIAVVTGGSRGLGRATALRLANAGVGVGVGVVLTYRSQRAEADRVVTDITGAGGTAMALQLDTAVTAGFEDFADQLRTALSEHWSRDSFDYLVNNAGTNVDAPFAETTEKDFDDLFNVHFKGVFFLTQTLLPLIVDGGAILNVSTGLTRFTVPGQSAYAAMKGAIEVLTRYQAKELGARGIRVNAIAPGATATDFGHGLVRDNEQVRAYLSAQVARAAGAASPAGGGPVHAGDAGGRGGPGAGGVDEVGVPVAAGLDRRRCGRAGLQRRLRAGSEVVGRAVGPVAGASGRRSGRGRLRRGPALDPGPGGRADRDGVASAGLDQHGVAGDAPAWLHPAVADPPGDRAG